MTSIALIGPGRHGTVIAQGLVAHGAELHLYHHRPAKARAAADAIESHAKNGGSVTVAASAGEAIAAADVVFLTTLWDAPQRQVIGELGDALAGKILVDISNPLDVTPAGIMMRQPVEGSAGQFVATLLPAGTGHVKVFSNVPTAAILTAADKTPPAVLPFLADSDETAARIRPVLELTGWQPWYAGDISRSAELEIGGPFNRIQGRWGRAAADAAQIEALDGPERSV